MLVSWPLYISFVIKTSDMTLLKKFILRHRMKKLTLRLRVDEFASYEWKSHYKL